MKITKEWLIEKGACFSFLEWFENQENTDSTKIIKYFVRTKNHIDWANWLIVRTMDYKQYVSYAVFAAEQVIDIFERILPDNNIPRKAIEVAKKCIADPSSKNKRVAYDAAVAAASASFAASIADPSSRNKRVVYDAADTAADAAVYAAKAAYAADASAAAFTAATAADAAVAGAGVAEVDTYVAYAAAFAAGNKTIIKILKYGLKLLETDG